MLVLAIDTSTPVVTAGVARVLRAHELLALAGGGALPAPTTVLAERSVTDAFAHAERLMPLATEALAETGSRVADLEAVVVGLGPGPFTGLRVGVVTAAALADARGLPVVGVCSLDAIGTGARTVVTDARRKEVYWATYDTSGARVEGPGVVRPESGQLTGPFVGDPAFAERLGAPVTPDRVTTAGLLHAAAGLLDDPALLDGTAPPRPLVPLYLRRPDATPPTSFKPVTTT